MLAAELFLLEIDQLAERHLQDRVGLHGGERVGLAHAALVAGTRRSRRRPGRAASARPALRSPISRALASACVGRRADDADDFVDVGVRQQQAFDRVLALPGLGQQELRAAADHGQRDAG